MARLAASPPPATGQFLDPISCLKLPLLQGGKDITSYFNPFERVAELLEVDPANYADFFVRRCHQGL